MAGAGYKLFNTGDVLTAAQVNTYLQEQVVMVFANTTARTTALSGVLAEGMMSYLQDTNAVEVYNGSAWVSVGSTGDITGVTAGTGISGGGSSGDVTITNSMATAIDAKGDLIVGTGADTFSRLPVGTNDYVLTAASGEATGMKWAAPAGGGKVLQVVSSTSTTETTIANTALQDTGITATITPTSATSKILVLVSALYHLQRDAAFAYAAAELKRGATTIADYDGGNNFEWAAVNATGATSGRLVVSASIVYLDNPATTSSTTYKLQARTPTTANSNQITFQFGSAPSTITLLEIGA